MNSTLQNEFDPTVGPNSFGHQTPATIHFAIGDKGVTLSCDALSRGRHSLHHPVYCITTVTCGRHPLFTAITAARLLIREHRRPHEQGDVISLAWVVMPDLPHWLAQLNERRSFSMVVKTLKARSALSINRHPCPQGSLWQRAYDDRALRKEEDFRQIARSIVVNPLRAGLVRNIGHYHHWDCIWSKDDDETPGRMNSTLESPGRMNSTLPTRLGEAPKYSPRFRGEYFSEYFC